MSTADDESTRLSDDFRDIDDDYSPPESKRMRLDDGCNNNLNSTLNSASKNGGRWNCPGDASLVEPEIMEDMGVSMLEDEEVGRESRKKLRSQERRDSESDGKETEENGNARLDDRYLILRDGGTSEANLERLEKDAFDLEDPGAFGTPEDESGYSSRVEAAAAATTAVAAAAAAAAAAVEHSFTAKNEANLLADESTVDQFYLYRRKKRPSATGEDKFNNLSDEMILSILKWLPKTCLVRSMLVCKRWCQIARDEALWSRLNLGGKVLNEGTLGHILPRGVQILRLAQAEIADPVLLQTCEILLDGYHSKLQYLDLSMAVISPNGLASLLSRCKLLKKLSLENCVVNESCCEAIGQNVDLSILNMTMCDGIGSESIKYIAKLKSLISLNVAWCNLDSTAIATLCESLPPSMTRLNVAGCRKTLTDEDVNELTKSCPDLVELDLSDCTLLTMNSVHSLMNLTKLEHLSLSRCYSIPASTYLRLAHMPSLLYLDVFGLMAEATLKILHANSGGTKINKFLYSSVARPTVGPLKRSFVFHLPRIPRNENGRYNPGPRNVGRKYNTHLTSVNALQSR